MKYKIVKFLRIISYKQSMLICLIWLLASKEKLMVSFCVLGIKRVLFYY